MFLFVFDPFVAAFVVSSLMVGMGIRNCVGLLLPQMNERMMILGTVQNQSQPGCWSSNTWQNWQGRGTWLDICTQLWWNKHGGGGQWASLGSGGRMTCRAGQLIELPAELVSFGQQPPSNAWKAWPACWPADAWCSCSSGRLQAWSPADCLSCKSHLLSITQSTRTPAPIRICEFPFASVPGAGTASYCCCLSDSAMHAAYRFPCWRLLWRAPCLLVLHRVSPLLVPCGCLHRSEQPSACVQVQVQVQMCCRSEWIQVQMCRWSEWIVERLVEIYMGLRADLICCCYIWCDLVEDSGLPWNGTATAGPPE